MPNTKQIQLIQVAKRKLCLADDDYRAILEHEAGVTSCTDLDFIGFDRVMKRFEALGFQSTWQKNNYGKRQGMASPDQIKLIRKLWCDFSGGDVDEKDRDLNAWLHKYHRVSALRMVSAAKTKQVIAALKQMAARTKSKNN